MVTRLGAHGGPRPPYGSFAGKTLSSGDGAHPVDHITRLGAHGGARPLYGSFAGKTPAGPSAPKQGQGIYFLRTVGKLMNN